MVLDSPFVGEKQLVRYLLCKDKGWEVAVVFATAARCLVLALDFALAVLHAVHVVHEEVLDLIDVDLVTADRNRQLLASKVAQLQVTHRLNECPIFVINWPLVSFCVRIFLVRVAERRAMAGRPTSRRVTRGLSPMTSLVQREVYHAHTAHQLPLLLCSSRIFTLLLAVLVLVWGHALPQLCKRIRIVSR